jgi:hypothetical protein
MASLAAIVAAAVANSKTLGAAVRPQELVNYLQEKFPEEDILRLFQTMELLFDDVPESIKTVRGAAEFKARQGDPLALTFLLEGARPS